jgi:hypothetical protein
MFLSLSTAAMLLGKNVTFYAVDEMSGAMDTVVGTVDSVFNNPETGESLLGVKVGDGEGAEEYTLGLDAVILVED